MKQTENTPAPKAGGNLDELYPALGFVITYVGVKNLFSGEGAWAADAAIYWATAITIIVSLGLIGWKKLHGQKVSPVLWFITILVTVMGVLVIGLQEDAAVYMKPSFVNTLFALLIFGSLTLGFNPIKYMVGEALVLPDKAWFWMAVRWGIFFIAMVIWNEYLWRTYCPLPDTPFTIFGATLAPNIPYSFMGFEFGLKDAEGVWAGWKLGNFGFTMAFVIINAVFIYPYLKDQAPTDPPEG